MSILITGGTGFIGSHLTRLLVDQGEQVRVLVRSSSNRECLKGVPVEFVEGDLRDADSLKKALKACQLVFHVAADYRLWARNPSEIYANNVDGTESILKAAAEYNIPRIVYTSTVGCLGNPGDGTPGTEETPVRLDDMAGHYKRSKYLAEQIAISYAKAGLPVVIVNPSTPVGPGDWKPTPTGKIIVDFLNGKIPAFVDTGLNLVDVDDVARGHLLAAEKGRIGEKYILGNRNLTLQEILSLLAQITRRKAPKIQIPYYIALTAGWIDTQRAQLFGPAPSIPLEGVRMAKKKMFFLSEKAVHELGLPQSSIESALERAVRWYSDHGYVRNK